jgi:7-cyano-7-deazaguanine synthase
VRVVLLASGGLDSTTCWWLLRARAWTVVPLFIDYGHGARAREWEVVRHLAAAVSSSDAVLLRLLPSPYPAEPAYGLLPARNLMLLSLAVAYAGSRGMRAVAIGSTADDAQHADGSAAFRSLAQRALACTPPRVRLLAPLAGRTKRDVATLARALDAPIHATVSCYRGEPGGCGDCRGCLDRRSALSAR